MRDCPKLAKKKQREKERANVATENEEGKKDGGEVTLISIDLDELDRGEFALSKLDPRNDMFVADSGASVHMTSSLEGMVNLSDCN